MRNRAYLLFILVLVMLLGACSHTPVSEPTESESADSEAEESVTQESEAASDNYLADPSFDTDEYLPSYDWNWQWCQDIAGCFAETENAIYAFQGVGGHSLYYYDKATGLSDVLCFKPECDHSGADCGGYIDSPHALLTVYDGHLYFMAGKGEHILYRCNTDGSQREKVLTVSQDYVLSAQPQYYILHRGYLYGIGVPLQVQPDGTPAGRVSITAFCLEKNREGIKIFEDCYEGSIGMPSVFCRGNQLFFHYQTGTIDDKTIKLFSWDSKTRTLNELWTAQDSNLYMPTRGGLWAEDNEIWLAMVKSEKTVSFNRLTQNGPEEMMAADGIGLHLGDNLICLLRLGEGGNRELVFTDFEGRMLRELTLSDSDYGKVIGFSWAGMNGDHAYFALQIMENGGLGFYLMEIDLTQETEPKIIMKY